MTSVCFSMDHFLAKDSHACFDREIREKENIPAAFSAFFLKTLISKVICCHLRCGHITAQPWEPHSAQLWPPKAIVVQSSVGHAKAKGKWREVLSFIYCQDFRDVKIKIKQQWYLERNFFINYIIERVFVYFI